MKKILVEVGSSFFAYIPLVVIAGIVATFLGEQLGYSAGVLAILAQYFHAKLKTFFSEKLNK
jgi:hypothetical protein